VAVDITEPSKPFVLGLNQVFPPVSRRTGRKQANPTKLSLPLGSKIVSGSVMKPTSNATFSRVGSAMLRCCDSQKYSYEPRQEIGFIGSGGSRRFGGVFVLSADPHRADVSRATGRLLVGCDGQNAEAQAAFASMGAILFRLSSGL